MLNRRKMVK